MRDPYGPARTTTVSGGDEPAISQESEMAPSALRGPDFKVFEVTGFQPRMAEIRTRIRPKLESLGHRLAPTIAKTTGGEVFAHVAKHARRTVNPPDDTWVAFGPDARGYKKHPHFKVAVSRNTVRFLFEIGPEHADKKRWTAAWRANAGNLGRVLRRAKGLAWFKNEHDDEPAAALADLSPDDLVGLGEALIRVRDGQIVLGRAVPASEAARWTDAQYRDAALETFRTLVPLYRLR
jgi:uncharacterized protein YktB (UPF0637 family)